MPDPARVRWPARLRSALRHSLRLRLVLVFLTLALATTAIFIAGSQRAIGMGWRQALEPLLSDYVDRLAAEVGSPPSVDRARALTQRLPVSVRIDGPLVRWTSHPDAEQAHGRWHERRARHYGAGPGLLQRATADGHVVSFGLGDLPWRSQPRLIGWATLAGLLVLTALAYGYVRRLLRPLDDIRIGAARFGSGVFDQPIAVRRRDELGELAAQINTMAHDLHRMLEGKRALLLAISHELRSPLTRARVHAELLPDEGPAGTARAALLRDLAQMRDLIDDLLEGERLAGAHAALQREPVDVAQLVHELVAARPDFGRVVLHLPPELPQARIDPVRVRLALRNLLDNALRHGAAERPPELQVRLQGDDLAFAVRDFGPGVDEAQLAHLADAFYRTDGARQRSTGGVGLGLNLARLVAQAHGGSLQFANRRPGLVATLVVPRHG